MEITIRPFRPEHKDQIISVIKKCYEELGWELELDKKDADLNDIRDNYQINNGQFWILWVTGEIRGCIALQKHGKYFHLRRFYILNQFRGLGLGKMMVSHLLDHAQFYNIRDIQLSTKDRHSAAYHIFQRLGFLETKHSDLSLRCHIYMKKIN